MVWLATSSDQIQLTDSTSNHKVKLQTSRKSIPAGTIRACASHEHYSIALSTSCQRRILIFIVRLRYDIHRYISLWIMSTYLIALSSRHIIILYFLVSRSVYLHLICLAIYFSIQPSNYTYMSVHNYLNLSVHVSIFLSGYSLFNSIYLSIAIWHYLAISLSVSYRHDVLDSNPRMPCLERQTPHSCSFRKSLRISVVSFLKFQDFWELSLQPSGAQPSYPYFGVAGTSHLLQTEKLFSCTKDTATIPRLPGSGLCQLPQRNREWPESGRWPAAANLPASCCCHRWGCPLSKRRQWRARPTFAGTRGNTGCTTCSLQDKINSSVIPNSLEDLGRFLYRSPPELCLLCAPDSSATLSAICTGTIRNFMGHLHRDPPNLISHPEPSRTWPFETSSGICIGTLRNFVCYVHRTAQQLCLLSAPEPSGTSWAICTGTLRTWSAIRNPPEPDRSRPHQASASEPSGTLSAMCTGQLSNFACYLHRNHPELHGPSAPGPSELDQPSGTLQNLTVRDLIKHLHRNPPELCLLCAPDSSATLSAICTGTIRNFMGHLHRDPPNLISHPEPSRTWPFETSSGICIGTLRNFVCYVHRTAQQLCLLSAPEPSGTSWAICTGTLRTWSAIRNPPASHQPSTPEPSRTSSAFCPEPSVPEPFGTLSTICTRNLRNFISYLHRNPPELHQPAAPELSGTSSAICTGTLRNLISNLHRKAPEPSGTFSGTWCCSCTGSHQSFSGLKTP